MVPSIGSTLIAFDPKCKPESVPKDNDSLNGKISINGRKPSNMHYSGAKTAAVMQPIEEIPSDYATKNSARYGTLQSNTRGKKAEKISGFTH